MAITAGYNVRIRKSGSVLTATTEAFTLVSGKTYKVTDRDKVRWDRTQTVSVFDNAVPVASTNYTIQYLTGVITFIASYTPTTPITATYKYFPATIISYARSGSINEMVDLEDVTTFATAEEDITAGEPAARRKQTLLLSASGTVGDLFDYDDNLLDSIGLEDTLILEFQPNYAVATDITYVEAILESNDADFDIENVNRYTFNWQSNGAIEYEPV